MNQSLDPSQSISPSTSIIHNPPTLYQINARKQIYQWRVYVERTTDNRVCIVCEHGVKGGNLVPHNKEITNGKGVGKAKKTIENQAIFEANSLWRDKIKKSGYLEVLPIQNLNINLNQNTNDSSISNSNSNTPFYPMLANTFTWDLLDKKKTKIAFPLYTQRKYDGIRCFTEIPENLEIILKSRKATIFYHLNHIRDALIPMCKIIQEELHLQSNDIIFDGELYTTKIPFEQISGIVRQKKALSADDTIKQLHMEYHIYDIYVKTRPDLPFEQRLSLLTRLFERYDVPNSPIRHVPTYTITTREEIKTYHDQFVTEGFEGIMLRHAGGPYEPKKRSSYLLKYKEFLEEEFPIIGFHEGEGDDVGTVIWECQMPQATQSAIPQAASSAIPNAKVFSVKPRGTREQRREWLENAAEYMGKPLTVIYQELSADGIPRFPVGKAIRMECDM
jgi:ATP-dependent DNA ligase